MKPEFTHRLGTLCRIWRGIKGRRRPRRDIVLDEANVIGPAGSVSLSIFERQLLAFFLENSGVVLTPETLLSRVWGPYRIRDLDFLHATVASLNDAMQKAGFAPGLIEDVHGVGYWFKPGSVAPRARRRRA
jgi:DNA-binding response OmpR family regulator